MPLRESLSKLLPHRLGKLAIGTALLIAAIGATNALVLAQLHDSTLHEVESDLVRQSRALSELTERTLEASNLVLGSVAEKAGAMASADGNAQQWRSEEFHTFLKDQMSGLPQIFAMGVIDARGDRLNFSKYWPAPEYNLSYREYFKALKANPKRATVLDGPIRGIATNEWLIAVARPILTNTGQFAGVAYATTHLSYFEDLFRATSNGDGYAATLALPDGTLLMRYPAAGEIGKRLPLGTLATMHNGAGISHAVSVLDHQMRIAVGRKLSNYPLVVVASQTEAAAFADWRTTVLIMGLIAAVMSGAIVIAAFLMARSWKQQERLNAARAAVIESEKTRALAEAELERQRDLAEQSMRLDAAVENMAHGLCMFDKDKKLVICNDIYANLYRLPPELLQAGSRHSDIIAHRVRSGILKGGQDDGEVERRVTALESLPRDRRSSRVDEHADGRLIRITRNPLPGGGWVATHEDITEQRRAERELDETRQFLDSIIENIPLAVAVKDAKTRQYVLVNRAFETMLDLPEHEVLGRTAFMIHRQAEADFIDEADQAALAEKSGVYAKEYEFRTRTAGVRFHATKRIIIRDGQGEAKYLICVIEDVTERKQSEQRIAFMAHHDALTGLANRAAIALKIEEAAARQRRWGEPFTVLLLDLDRFKHVNDTLGHSAGDALLREAATRLKSFLRETDVLARLGGDEFAIIQAGEDRQREAASRLSERVIEVIARPFDIDGNEVNIGTSIGIALAPEHGTNPDSLLKMADMALYSAKSAGRNGYRFFNPDMGAAATARHALETELRRAVVQNELVLHYQPIIDSKSGRICGAEALVRWQHPNKGLIRPDKFIPLAEETGIITQIGEWVLRTACADAALWPADVKVAINLSPLQFRKVNLSDIVMDALAKSGLPPQRLEIEITETALIESAAECLPALHRFKKAGIAIALDDFGTGYSSLSQLTMFPFDKIKIDKSFTQNLTKRSECAAIISAALTLAQSLDIATTAEGVETADQYRLLKLAGVTSLQGYLFKRPVPVDEIDFEMSYAGPIIANVA